MKKNIWIINQYTGTPYYGMNYRSYYLAKEFVKQGYNVTIFTSSFSHLFVNFPKTNGIFTSEMIEGIKYIWVKTPKYKKSKSFMRMISMLSFMVYLFFYKPKNINKPDVIIISSLSLFPVLNAYLWSKKYKIDFIFEVRDLWPLSLIELSNISKKNIIVKFFSLFEKLGYAKSKYTVSVLENAKDYMVTQGLKENKFIYIPNGICLEEMVQKDNLAILTNNKIPKNKFIIGYTGTIGIANALEYLLFSAKRLIDNKDIHFVIVGRGNNKNDLKKYIAKENLTNVTLIDFIPKSQIPTILEKFDVCYIGGKKTNLYKYGLSQTKLFEYMYAAKPIIHSYDNLKNNIVYYSKCGICVEAENVDQITEAILQLWKMNEKELKIMGENGKKYVIKYHSYKNLSKKYLNIINKVIEKGGT